MQDVTEYGLAVLRRQRLVETYVRATKSLDIGHVIRVFVRIIEMCKVPRHADNAIDRLDVSRAMRAKRLGTQVTRLTHTRATSKQPHAMHMGLFGRALDMLRISRRVLGSPNVLIVQWR